MAHRNRTGTKNEDALEVECTVQLHGKLSESGGMSWGITHNIVETH
jgi:hypothetical protein